MANSRICSIPDCGKPVSRRERCESHYRVFLKTAKRIRPAKRGTCQEPGCSKPHAAKGYCRTHHYAHFVRDPSNCRASPGASAEFVAKALKSETRECIEWPFARDEDGYGVASRRPFFASGSRKIGAHRLVCQLVHGAPFSDDLHAMHSCDNRSCINPHHLEWGTSKTNVNDALARGRIKCGSQRSDAKLNEQSVRDIRKSTSSDADLARRYGVTPPSIRRARLAITWRHVSD